MNHSEMLQHIAELRAGDLDREQVDKFLRQLEAMPADETIDAAVADQYDRLNEVLDGLAAAVDEFRGLGSAIDNREKALKAARTRFAIQLSALVAADGDFPLDTLSGSSLSTSLCRFRDNLRAVATRMAELVEQTIEDSGLRKELELAGAVQGMLVSDAQGKAYGHLVAHAWYSPAEQCAGDLFTIDRLGDDDALVFLGDATGHGAPAAIVAAVVKGACDLARLGMRGALQPFQLLRMLNRVLVESVQGEYLMTCIAARYRGATRTLEVANAGHRALWVVRDGKVRTVPGGGEPPLGARSVYRFEGQELKLAPGDIVVLYTDGIPECESPDGVEFGERRMREVIVAHAPDGGEAIITAMRETIAAHLGGLRANDDLTMVCLTVQESAA